MSWAAHPHRITRPAVATVVGWIAFGAVCTIVVAWGAAICVDIWTDTNPRARYYRAADSSDGWIVAMEWKRPAATLLVPSPMTTLDGIESSWMGGRARRMVRPSWAPGVLDYSFPHMLIANGWPFRSMYLNEPFKGSFPPEDSATCIPVQLPVIGKRVLPLRFIWTGFLADTLVFAALGWGACALSRRLVQCCRCRRGRCVSCGYQLAQIDSSACPECGNLRQDQADPM